MNKPFWEREFPLVYRCKRCDEIGIMREPEPWAGHACSPSVLDEIKNTSQPIDNIFDFLGEWEFVVEGEEAINFIKIHSSEGIVNATE